MSISKAWQKAQHAAHTPVKKGGTLADHRHNTAREQAIKGAPKYLFAAALLLRGLELGQETYYDAKRDYASNLLARSLRMSDAIYLQAKAIAMPPIASVDTLAINLQQVYGAQNEDFSIQFRPQTQRAILQTNKTQYAFSSADKPPIEPRECLMHAGSKGWLPIDAMRPDTIKHHALTIMQAVNQLDKQPVNVIPTEDHNRILWL